MAPLPAIDEFHFEGDQLTSTLTPGDEQTILSGSAHVDTGTLAIDADRIELSGKSFRYVSCTGHVKVVDHERGIEVAADSLVYDRTQKIGRFQGDITVRDPDHETLIKAGWLEYYRQDEKMSLQVGVRIIKNDIVCQSENADYDRKTDTLELTGLPRVFKKNDVYEAGRIRVNLKTEEILLDGRVDGTVVVDQKKPGASTTTTTTDAPPEAKKADTNTSSAPAADKPVTPPVVQGKTP